VSSLKKIFTWIAIAIPPSSFYFLLARSLNRFPYGDDYGAILNFLLRWKKESGAMHIVEIVTFQHNEYKLIFEHAIVGLQYAILGHTDILALKILGDLFVIPLFVMLYLIWRECGRSGEYALLVFVPVSWILFQLQYEGTLNYTMAGLETVPVNVFALLTCLLATKKSRASLLGSILSLLLCIASNGNGLLMIPIGAIIFLQQKKFKRLLAWTCCSAIACLIYFLNYNFRTVVTINTHTNNDVVSILQNLQLTFTLAFLGNIAAILNPWPAVIFGTLLAGIFAFATWDRLFLRHPSLYYSALFFFVTAIAVSGHRSYFGLSWALNSIYRLYSTVLLSLLYLYLADKAYGLRVRPVVLKACACAFAALLVGFTFESDRGGQKVLLLKQQRVEVAMLSWERHEPAPPLIAQSPDDLTVGRESDRSFWPGAREPILSESIREGIYTLPEIPKGN